MTLRTLMLAGPTKVNELFARIAETSDGAVKTREKLFAELKAELELHTSLEEQHLFPVLRRNAETKDLVADAVRDNRELRAKLAELEALPNDEAFRSGSRSCRRSSASMPGTRSGVAAGGAAGAERRAGAERHREDGSRPCRGRAGPTGRGGGAARQGPAGARGSRVPGPAGRAAGRAGRRPPRGSAAVEALPRETTQQTADAARKPVKAAAEVARQATRLVAGTAKASSNTDQRPQAQASAPTFAEMFLWPWMGAMQSLQQASGSGVARGVSGMEEVIPLGEEVLEVSKRTENRGTARFTATRRDACRGARHPAERAGGGGAPPAGERQGDRRDPDRGNGRGGRDGRGPGDREAHPPARGDRGPDGGFSTSRRCTRPSAGTKWSSSSPASGSPSSFASSLRNADSL